MSLVQNDEPLTGPDEFDGHDIEPSRTVSEESHVYDKQSTERLEPSQYFSNGTYSRFFPSLSFCKHLRPSSVSLLRGDGDLLALGLYLAASTSWLGNRYYFHGSIIPEVDRLLKLIMQLQPDIPVICVPRSPTVLSSDPQYCF